ncbi:autotransporter strand-loop-strand O-heptosyltransferase [Anaeroselena agilis]|uniref:Autotransporter strand-loop-strand O-heptosyltransferase n=1 Tax=Anaeroselena agilis TaxID=3063788 RepID=A0ABU3P3B1_9FIRM|nr:autotransporter strand-loop-strand O-heptosyltransferase [Selenomonadales bacterium 4137-cl]
MTEAAVREAVAANAYMAFYNGPLTCKTDIPGLEFDFNHGARVKVPAGDWRVKLSDRDSFTTLFDAAVSDTMVTSVKKYYVNFRLEIFRDGRLVLDHEFTPKKRRVLLQYPLRSVLGDNIAAFPYGQAFKYLHDCEVYCAIEPRLAELFKATYPDVNFVKPGERPEDIYATYYMGYFYPAGERAYQPADWRILGLQKAAAGILGLTPQEIRPAIAPENLERQIAEPYVCIAAQATSQAKYWNNPHGWIKTVEHLKARGYRVLCIDRERVHGQGRWWNGIPYGAEDFTGDRPLSERVDLLHHADFFVGLGSGLSWLAWAVGKPVVMISGFSLPQTEFYTPYRVINHHVCNGCFTDSGAEFANDNFAWCPRLENTDRQFECTRLIAAGQVNAAIDRLMADHGLRPAKTAV